MSRYNKPNDYDYFVDCGKTRNLFSAGNRASREYDSCQCRYRERYDDCCGRYNRMCCCCMCPQGERGDTGPTGPTAA